MLGLFIGAVLLGRLSDVLGRRITITLSILLAAIAQIAGGLAQNWPTYAITRFFAGIGLLIRIKSCYCRKDLFSNASIFH